MNFTIGIDIGGTNTAIGIAAENGEIMVRTCIPTTGERTAREYVDRLAGIVAELSDRHGLKDKISGIGIGAPAANGESGMIEGATNLPWPSPIPLRALMEEKTGLPVFLTNDANAAALGEMTYGCARKMHDFIFITLGTGVGAGIVCDGRLLSGVRGLAGELGHIIIDPHSSRQCACGRKGCLQTYCSASGIVRTALNILESDARESSLREIRADRLTSRNIGDAAVAGDDIARRALGETGRTLGFACAQFAAFTSPEAIILFGGPMQAGDLIMSPLKESFRENTLFLHKDTVKILRSSLPEADAAILGAAALPLMAKSIDLE